MLQCATILVGTGATNFETNSKDASMAPFSQFWSGARASVIALNALCQWLFYVRALMTVIVAVQGTDNYIGRF